MGGFYAENYAALYSWQHAMHHVDGWGDEYLRDGEGQFEINCVEEVEEFF